MVRATKDEVEAAYFTLLRARERVSSLQRYAEFLEREQLRLDRFIADGDALDAHVDAALRRSLRHTDRPLAQAIKSRRDVMVEELKRLPERLRAAEEFVNECEEEHQRLRARG